MTGPTRRRLFLALALGLVLVGISLRTIHLGRPALCCDEFFDVYSARSWLAGEGFQVPGRENERALMMARATGASFAAFGESEWSARLPAVVLGILTLPLIALAGRVLFGPVAAIVALGLLAISPHGIDVSRFARLYSPLTILLLGGVIAIYIGLEGRRRDGPVLRLSRILWLAGGGLLILAGTHFHPAALAVGPAIQLYVGVRALYARARGDGRAAALYLTVFAGLTLCEVAVALTPALREKLLTAALVPLPWYRPTPGASWVHYQHLLSEYGWVWYLVGVASIVVLAAGRAGLFVSLAFWVPFVLISVGVATKHHRYTVQLLPFAWLAIGGAAQLAWTWLAVRLSAGGSPPLIRTRAWLAGQRGLPRAAAAWVLALMLSLAALLAVAKVSPSVPEAFRRPFQSSGTFTLGTYYDWRGLARALEGRIDPGAVVVSDRWHELIYYLRVHADQLLPAYRVWGAGDWEMPVRDYSIKVQKAEHVQSRIASRPVWVIVSASLWRRPGYYDSGLSALVTSTCRPVTLPSELQFVVAFDCGGPGANDGRSAPGAF